MRFNNHQVVFEKREYYHDGLKKDCVECQLVTIINPTNRYVMSDKSRTLRLNELIKNAEKQNWKVEEKSNGFAFYPPDSEKEIVLVNKHFGNSTKSNLRETQNAITRLRRNGLNTDFLGVRKMPETNEQEVDTSETKVEESLDDILQNIETLSEGPTPTKSDIDALGEMVLELGDQFARYRTFNNERYEQLRKEVHEIGLSQTDFQKKYDLRVEKLENAIRVMAKAVEEKVRQAVKMEEPIEGFKRWLNDRK